TFVDLSAIPKRTILLFQSDQLTTLVHARCPSRILQQHQREQAHVLRFIREQFAKHTSETNGFRTQIVSKQALTCACRISFVEDEIDHCLNCKQTFTNDLKRRNLV